MRQLDAGDVLQGLRVEDRQFAAIGAPVIDVTHQHAVVLCGTARRWVEDELSQGFFGRRRRTRPPWVARPGQICSGNVFERSVTDMPAIGINAKYKSVEVRERRSGEAQMESADTIKYYVDHLADIAIFADETGGTLDFDTPLGDTLPASIDPETAAWLASDLRAALPRIRELLGLLSRRSREDD